MVTRIHGALAAGFLALGCSSGAELEAELGQVRQRAWLQQEQRLQTEDPGQGYKFGTEVAVDGDWALAGAVNDEELGLLQGAAYVFQRTAGTWARTQKLLPADGLGRCGVAVAVEGDWAFVGCSGSPAGAVYVYQQSAGTWSFTERLDPDPGTLGPAQSIAISGDTVAYGAHTDDDVATRNGAVYVHTRSGSSWPLQTKILADDAAANSELGKPLALDGDWLAVAAKEHLYFFQRVSGSWAQASKVTPTGNSLRRIALHGSRAAARDSTELVLYELQGGSWVEAHRFGPDGDTFGSFGHVALFGEHLVVGETENDTAADRGGAALLYERGDGGWPAAQKLTPPDLQAGDLFGYGVAFDGASVLIGSPEARDLGAGLGAVYAFSLQTDRSLGAPCDFDAQCGSGHCADGACCDDACDSSCRSCTESKTGQPDGTCANTLANTDPDQECGGCFACDGAGGCEAVAAGTDPGDDCADSGVTCGADGFCDGAGSCRQFAPTTSACGATTCVAGVQSGALCDGLGTCRQAAEATCGTFKCDGDAVLCLLTCTVASDCLDGHWCEAGSCVPRLTAGSACSDASACDSGHCVDGVCCSSSCSGQCEACDIAGSEGLCAPVTGAPHGSRTPCGGDAGCEGSCDGIDPSACSFPVGESCAEDTCSAGALQHQACNAAGQCLGAGATPCRPYQCGDASSCATQCTSDPDCAPGYRCADGECITTDAGRCDATGIGLIDSNNDIVTRCAPYRCQEGRCATSCSDTSDCGADAICEAGRCQAPGTASSRSDSGCQVAPAGSTNGLPILLAVGLLGLCLGRRRSGAWLALSTLGLAGCSESKTADSSVTGAQSQPLYDNLVATFEGGHYGSGNAADGDTFLVSRNSLSDRDNPVEVYERVGGQWTLADSLAPATIPNNWGGFLSLDGEWAVISSSGDDAVVYQRNGGGWNEHFSMPGKVAVISGDAVLLDDNNDVNVWRRAGASWNLEQPLGFCNGEGFALDGDLAAIGNRDEICLARHSAGVWSLEATLVPAGIADDDGLGRPGSMALDGDTLALGTYQSDHVAPQSGAVHVYVREAGSWALQQTLTSSDAAPGDWFGWSVDLQGDRLVVAANHDDDDGFNTGSTYLFERVGSVWTEVLKLTRPDAGEGSFGIAALAGSAIVVSGHYSPAAYVFEPTVELANGAACDVRDECASGSCVDGVCCDTPCSGSCEACAASLTGGNDGICAPIGAGQDPEDECGICSSCDGAGSCQSHPVGTDPDDDCDADSNPCGADGLCSGVGTCRLLALAGTSCGAPSCSAGLLTEQLCDGGGACLASESGCAPGSCAAAANACTLECANEADCAAGAFCQASQCVGAAQLGDSCATDAECTSGHCADGVCCSVACDGQCEACDLTGLLGTCSPVLGAVRGARPPCAGADGECAGFCDGMDRSACSYPVARPCGELACSGGVATRSECNDEGACVESPSAECFPYLCAGTGCGSSCAATDDCASGHVCDFGACVPQTVGRCADDGSGVLGAGDEVIESCFPYFCNAGSCPSTCTATNECAEGYVCDVDARSCVVPTAAAASEDSGGCGCRLAERRDAPSSEWLWLLVLGMLGRRASRDDSRVAEPNPARLRWSLPGSSPRSDRMQCATRPPQRSQPRHHSHH